MANRDAADDDDDDERAAADVDVGEDLRVAATALRGAVVDAAALDRARAWSMLVVEDIVAWEERATRARERESLRKKGEKWSHCGLQKKKKTSARRRASLLSSSLSSPRRRGASEALRHLPRGVLSLFNLSLPLASRIVHQQRREVVETSATFFNGVIVTAVAF